MISKKKKGHHRYRDWFFVQFRKFSRLRGGLFSNGGAIFHFSQKIGLKSKKNMRFCILHKPMGWLEPPRPPPWLRYWLEPPVRYCEYLQSPETRKAAKPPNSQSCKVPQTTRKGARNTTLLDPVRSIDRRTLMRSSMLYVFTKRCEALLV